MIKLLVVVSIAILAQACAHASPSVIPFEIASNHIYLKGTFDDAERWFLFDTGATASYVASPLCSKETPRRSGALVIGPVTVAAQSFNCWRVSDLGFDGHALDGLLGYDFISRYVVEIDYQKRTLSLHDPARYTYVGTAVPAKLSLIADDSGGMIPLATVSLSGADGRQHKGPFIVDTGARTAFTLGDRIAQRSGLTADSGGAVRMLIGGGSLVREARMAVRRASSATFAGHTFAQPVITISEDKTGILAAPEFDGVVGGELLRRFRVIFDYARSVMFLEPTQDNAAPFEFDRSGMFVSGDGADFRTFTIRDVLHHSPASDAGLEVRDVILAIDGVRARDMSLEEVRARFKIESRSYTITVKRADRTFQVRLHTRRIV